MKKYFAALTLLTVTMVGYFAKYTVQIESEINAPIMEVSAQLTTPENWQRWQPDLKRCANSSDQLIQRMQSDFTVTCNEKSWHIEVRNPTELSITFTNERNSHEAHLWLVANKNNRTVVRTIRRVPIYERVIKQQVNSHQLSAVEELKTFLEDPAQYYGYPIEIRPVSDSNVLVMKKRIPVVEQYRSLNKLLSALRTYIKDQDLIPAQHPMAVYANQTADSVTITAMYGIERRLPFLKGSIRFHKMPKEGRMLIGRFKGPFKDKHQLYSAMQRYINDKNLTAIITPYEKYLNGAPPASDESDVLMEVCFPIY